MHRIMNLALVFLLAVTARAETLHGTWSATQSTKDPSKVQFQLSYGSHNQFGHTMSIDSFTGLTPAQIASAAETPVTFELRREAGTFALKGTFEHGDGVGHFTFEPNHAYFATLASMGVERDRERDEDQQLLTLAILDVSTSFVREMREEGYDVPLQKYISMRIFGVTRGVIAEYRRLGFDHLPYDRLIAFRIHGVTPAYIEEMRSSFGNLTADQMVTSRIHGATPEFARSMRDLGYHDLEFDDLVRFRIHGVSAGFISDLASLGYKNISAEDLVRMRIHGVTPEYIRQFRTAGYSGIPVEKLIKMRIQGIDAEFMSKMSK